MPAGLEEVRPWVTRLAHRGPDNLGIVQADGVIFGHTRLSIIDLDPRSNQPLATADGRLSLVFNGEIYNYRELRKRLAGYDFRTDSDSEVILAAYAAWGLDFVRELRGMFALAIHDRRAGTIVVARDRVGKKPLYYAASHGTLAFASELRALEGLPGLALEPDSLAIADYFARGYIGGAQSVYAGIRKLPAGFVAVFDARTGVMAAPRAYWNLPEPPGPGHTADEQMLVEELDELLHDAVRVRLRSDVPLGVLLSGGVDSSLIACVAAAELQAPLRTFTISFKGTSSDETQHALRMAQWLQSDHEMIDANLGDIDHIMAIVSSLDEPLADSSLIPTALVSQLARRHVKVALGGDGGDELFAGYGHYDHLCREQALRQRAPRWARKFLGSVAGVLPERQQVRSFRRLALDDPRQGAAEYFSTIFGPMERARLLGAEVAGDAERDALSWIWDEEDWLEGVCRADFRHYLADDVLTKVDRMSMRCALEVRTPLLDQTIVEFAFGRVPSTLKRRGSVKKYLLKKVAEKYLPPDFDYARKHGFGVPLGQWFNGKLGTILERRLREAPSGTIDAEYALRFLASHRRGMANQSKRLFALLVWEEWAARSPLGQ